MDDMKIQWDYSFTTTDEAGRTDVVKQVNYCCVASDGGYEGVEHGIVRMPSPGQEFTDFTNLSEAQVCKWVEDIRCKDFIDAGGNAAKYITTEDAARLKLKKKADAPVIKTKPAPWRA